jgi:hypothetical protein
MSYRDSRAAYRALFATAVRQGGCFTATQAREAGYGYPHIDYHLRAGNFERIAHGLYRLPEIPASEHDDLIRLALWSRNRADEPQAVVSHDSALLLHELSDVLPRKVHLTVPPRFRKRPPKGCVLHRSRLDSSEIEERPGFDLTTPVRTLLDVGASQLPQEQLEKAISDALDRGLVRRSSLLAAIEKHPQSRRLSLCPALAHNRR